jgi:hypothetical protein
LPKKGQAIDKLDAQKKLSLKMREILGEAYGFIRGRMYTKQVSVISFEQLIDEAINRIEGTEGTTEIRGTLLSRIDRIAKEGEAAIDTVKKQPPSAWALDSKVEKKDRVNT